MHVVIFLSGLLATAYAAGSCTKYTTHWCNSKAISDNDRGCSVEYGHLHHVNEKLQQYVSLHINSSYNYLLMGTYYGGYVKNREGMEKALRHLSDSTWEDAIELIKHMNKRGLQVSFAPLDDPPLPVNPREGKAKNNTYSFGEIETLGRALDIQKLIAKKAIDIHHSSSELARYDPEISSFLENNFLHRHADNIRNLAGLVHDLKKFVSHPNIDSLSVFLFDEYLKKVSV